MRAIAASAALVLGVAIVVALAVLATAPAQVAPTAAVAAFAAVVGICSLLINLRQALLDRMDLRCEASLGYFGVSKVQVLQVRLYDVGRRPVHVIEVGFWSERSNQAKPYHHWFTWDREVHDPLPATIDDRSPLTVIAWPSQVARWYVRYPLPAQLFVQPLGSDRLWFPLPTGICERLAVERPEAERWHQAQVEKEERAQSGSTLAAEPGPGSTDGPEGEEGP